MQALPPLVRRYCIFVTQADGSKTFRSNLTCFLEIREIECQYAANSRIRSSALFQNALQANPQLACLSGMDAGTGIFTTGLRVAGVPIGNDEWVQQFVQAKTAAVQVDAGKLDNIYDSLIHYQMLRFLPKHSSCFSWAQYSNTPHIRHLCKSRCHDFF